MPLSWNVYKLAQQVESEKTTLTQRPFVILEDKSVETETHVLCGTNAMHSKMQTHLKKYWISYGL